MNEHINKMPKFRDDLKYKLKTDKEYAIMWLEDIVKELEAHTEELKVYIEAISEDKDEH